MIDYRKHNTGLWRVNLRMDMTKTIIQQLAVAVLNTKSIHYYHKE